MKKTKQINNKITFGIALGILVFFIIYNNLNEKIKIINPCPNNNPPTHVAIAFEKGFDKDHVNIKWNNTKIIDSIISTDPRLGLAEIVYIKNFKYKPEKVIIEINGRRFELNRICKQLVKINYINDTLVVEYLDHAKAYH